jgi:hypothetical protein
MTDEQDSGNDEHEAPPEAPEVKSIEPIPAPQSKPATEADLQEVEKQMNGFERSTLRWTRASFFIVLATAFFIGLQWLEMHSGGQDTHDLAVAAGKQAEKMKDMSDAADKIRLAAEGMAAQEQRIADNAEKALNASSKQSGTALAATIRQFRDDQRAWVGLGVFTIEHFDNKEAFRLQLPWANSGKTPAIDTQVAISYAITDTYMKGPPEDYRFVFTAASAIPPQGTYATTMTNLAAPLEYDAIVNGTKRFYVMGRFQYHDIYSRPAHTTSFCLVYSAISKTLIFCEQGNTMD